MADRIMDLDQYPVMTGDELDHAITALQKISRCAVNPSTAVEARICLASARRELARRTQDSPNPRGGD